MAMSADELVTDPLLRKVLEALNNARDQALECCDAREALYKGGKKPTEEELDNFAEKEKRLRVRLALLRGLYRKAVMYIRDTKQETAEARQEVDTLHLKLQNLTYEQQHLRGEITACEEYDHIYKKLPMITKEEFLALQPEHVDASEHDLTIARIQDEHAARQALEEQRQQLVKKKDALQKDVNKQKVELADLDNEVEKFAAGADKVNKKFELHEQKEAERRETERKDADAS